MKLISNTTSVKYRVTHEGSNGYFSPEGYSQYNDRYLLDRKGLLPPNEQIYGYAQAVAHIEELRKEEHRGSFPFADTIFHIEIIGTMTTRLLPDEGIPKKVVPIKEIDRFYQECRVTMFDMKEQKHIRGTVTGIDADRVRILWNDGQLCEYDLDQDLINIRVL